MGVATVKLRVLAIVAMVAILAAGAYSARALLEDGSGGGWLHEAGAAWEAERALANVFAQGRPNVTLIVDAVDGDIDDRAVARAANNLTTTLTARSDIVDVESYWSLGRPEWLRSEDGRSALILARIPGDTADFARRAAALGGIARNAGDAIEVQVGGEAMVHRDIAAAVRSLVIPLALVALVALALVFARTRSFGALILVALTSSLAVATTAVAVMLLARFREVPLLSLLLALAVAWGMASSGGYLMVRRFLAEQAAGADPRQAVAATVATAGRNVSIGVAVTTSGAIALWLMPTTLLRSSAYTIGVAAVIAGIAAVPVLGTLLAVFRWRMATAPVVAAATTTPPPTIDRVSQASVRYARPVAIVGVVGLIAVLVVGFSQVPLGSPGPETLTSAASSRLVAQRMAAFPADEAGAPFVLARGMVTVSQSEQQAAEYATELSAIPGVVRVDAAQGSYGEGAEIEVPREVTRKYRTDAGIWFRVPVAGSATGRTAGQVVAEIQDTTAPFRVQIGGLSARQSDTVGVVSGRTPAFLLIALVLSLLLVAWLLRSISAAVRAVLSIAAVTGVAGAVVWWGFASGGLSPVLGFVPTGSVDAIGPPLGWAVAFCIAGASMSYGWSAIREMNDVGHGDPGALQVALAATRSRHIEASLLLALPFAVFVFCGWRPAQLVGVVAVVTGITAVTLGRFVLIPALASLAPLRMWPVDARGDQRRVYPTTPAARLIMAAAARTADAVPVGADGVAGSAASVDPTPPMVDGTPIDEGAVVARDQRPPIAGEPNAEPAHAAHAEGDESAVPVVADSVPDSALPDSALPGAVAETTVSDDEDPLVTPIPARIQAEADPRSSGRSDDAVPAGDVALVEDPVAVAGPHPDDAEGEAVENPVATEPGSDVEVDAGDPSVSVADSPTPVAAGGDAATAEPPGTGAPVESDATTDPERTRVESPPVTARPEPEPVASEPVASEPVASEPVASEPVASEPVASEPVASEPVASEPVASEPVASEPVASEPVASEPVASEPVGASVAVEPVVGGTPVDPGPAGPEPGAAAVVDEAVEPASPRLQVAPQRDHDPTGDQRQPSEDASSPGAADHTPVRSGAGSGAVDVVSLTESVIASLAPGTPFTTEIGSGLVANPSNNLSRVMEAILRDASQRGGEEVLVYGHASRDRYRWMVVDSGPRADRDPDRARTLAEAQRFIRRVGGIVECRPEGDFTVFVVEIPMAS